MRSVWLALRSKSQKQKAAPGSPHQPAYLVAHLLPTANGVAEAAGGYDLGSAPPRKRRFVTPSCSLPQRSCTSTSDSALEFHRRGGPNCAHLTRYVSQTALSGLFNGDGGGGVVRLCRYLLGIHRGRSSSRIANLTPPNGIPENGTNYPRDVGFPC